ncbi:MAG: site-specific DNA-methyltransferase [Mesorhizobium sp.]|uniref:DNA-methyltransferase n=1 Tax=unclassified Mesorhizobium TaxID=325217 RepID=UPI000FCCA49C|nr:MULTISPECIES: site-specific DNA-methyltransferase [unclassified Mesorhizobium]RUW41369.1 site-specific DNA-methyltransferase [Mesorhizobium sp. M2A.F.Ca.ET.015.02.1.1]RVC97113.1 site-specific DNA-methyltransferase [Mesorhizobium sp. M2A.F.Ca.ET.017.03.2.1]RVD09124.1 site-specific DNA-methyltransferase [Mesorhizobium sp. M2A.F.Ca.ET.029.05.1.1]RWB37944.1 MAG: site-specific DNA-methyltransferase [Mesorhizobium sp.]RWB55295.1 MAG: site-specific DNA-methyltransferase [Mesorhizobium sp.]
MADWFETHTASIAASRPEGDDGTAPVYATALGSLYHGKSEEVLRSRSLSIHAGKVQLVMTSPPFPLSTKKAYGNHTQDEYVSWFACFAPLLRDMVTEDGSIVIEIGNAWMPGKPVMSTHVLEAFLAFLKKGDLHLCQEFIWYNPARLPSPVEWVNRERSRVKDAFTRIWWMSPNERPKADNRKVLREYSRSMKRLIKTGKYNAGPRPSAHNIGAESFKLDNGGAIPPNVGDVDGIPSIDGTISQGQFERTMEMIAEYEQATNLLKAANTLSSDGYRKFCLDHETAVHPARMPASLVEFFLRFLTDEGDTVLDPFAGSNTTGAVSEIMGRRWLGVEAEWRYAAHSIGRFDPERITSTCKGVTVQARKDDQAAA